MSGLVQDAHHKLQGGLKSARGTVYFLRGANLPMNEGITMLQATLNSSRKKYYQNGYIQSML